VLGTIFLLLFGGGLAVKGTETLITPRDLPIHESVLERTKHGRRGLSMPETVSTPGSESQALKSWIASLAADPMQNQSDLEPGGFCPCRAEGTNRRSAP